MRLRFWQLIWTQAVHRGLPLQVILWAEDRYLAAMPLGDRARVKSAAREALADTVPAPGEPWACLVGDGPELDADAGAEHAALVDLHGHDVWPSSRGGRTEWIA